MLEFTVGIILGIFIGGILTTIAHKAEIVGTLNIVDADDGGPSLYVELKEEVKEMCGKRYVMMKIREINTPYNEKR